MSNDADMLAAHVRRLSKNIGKPFAVAIDGRSGSGKSTLANLLKNRLDAVVLPGDDFYAGGVTLRQDPPDILAAECIDWRKQKAVLNSLLISGTAQYYPFDWEAFDGSISNNPVTLKVRPVVISEGVYSARSELRELYDILVLLETDDEVRTRNLLNREGEISAWDRQWHQAEDWYFLNSSPREIFDMVISE